MATRRRHKRDSEFFKDLKFSDQAKSITASINNLSAAIRRHIKDSPKRQITREKCILQLKRMLQRLGVP